MIKISTSMYYVDPKISQLEQEEIDADIRGKIEQVRVEFPRAGYRMLLPNLKRNGVDIGERRLRRIIRKFELQIKPKRRFVKTTDSNHKFNVYKNLIHEMTVDNINQVWVSDITYIRINNGFIYLAVILDVYSRRVVGWAISKKIDGQLALNALTLAITRRKPPRGCIHHSDRGVQYLCHAYVKKLTDHGFHISNSAKGNPYDNAWAESFMKTLKYDEIHLRKYETYIDVIERLPQFIEEVYNQRRLHSSLKYISPNEFEKRIEVEYQDGKSAGRPKLKL